MKSYSLEELTDQYIGKKGTTQRNDFDNVLRLDIIGTKIKQLREEQNLAQFQLG